MTELKPCPFCGGEAIITNPSAISSVICKRCSAAVVATTEYGAFKLWNQRAERTCKQVLTECNDGLMPPFTAHCSECGAQWGYTPDYCPSCGAKVVE